MCHISWVADSEVQASDIEAGVGSVSGCHTSNTLYLFFFSILVMVPKLELIIIKKYGTSTV